MTETLAYRRLVAAILVRAARDAQADDPDLAAPARRWLAGSGAAWAEMLDIPPERVTAWVGQLPTLFYEQLALFEL
ncbi:MAG: hypothetical protein DRI79_09980 [Chloroflexi bacterium]|nr:MAG: hypothetical protein DRI79_09980 [Chloroflexota bacterium]